MSFGSLVHVDVNCSLYDMRPPLKKGLFPVQRGAEIVASRAAAKSLFFSLFFLVRKF